MKKLTFGPIVVILLAIFIVMIFVVTLLTSEEEPEPFVNESGQLIGTDGEVVNDVNEFISEEAVETFEEPTKILVNDLPFINDFFEVTLLPYEPENETLKLLVIDKGGVGTEPFLEWIRQYEGANYEYTIIEETFEYEGLENDGG